MSDCFTINDAKFVLQAKEVVFRDYKVMFLPLQLWGDTLPLFEYSDPSVLLLSGISIQKLFLPQSDILLGFTK